MPKSALEQLRKYRSYATPTARGDIPELTFEQNDSCLIGNIVICSFIFVLSSAFSALLLCNILNFNNLCLPIAVINGTFLVCLYLFWPILYVKYVQFKIKQKPSQDILDFFGNRHYKNLKEYMIKKGFVKTIKIEKPTEQTEQYTELTSKTHHTKTPSSFRLWLGSSTGKLVDLWQKTGMAKGQQVSLDLEDACQNILVLGGIGSGKTTCVMQPILLQCLDQECGGLIFDIKGDVKHAVTKFAAATNRKLVFLGPGYNKINLLDGLTPEIAASFLKSAFLLNGKGHSDSFWVDTATELCRNTLGILSFLPQCYSLQNLYQYLFDLDSRVGIDNEVSALLPSLNDEQSRLLKTYQCYHETIFDQFDSKIKSGVNATVAQALSPFNHPALLDAFCSTEKSMIKMSDLLTGTVCIVDMPLSVWGLGGKVAYTFIKLRFFNLMQNRNQMKQTKQTKKDLDRPVFFMCDEFQEIVSASREGLSDLNFWDKSRSSKTIGIISSQSIASFYAALGNHDVANTLLQNFRQKLCLRTEDPITLDFMEKLIGKARIKKLSITRGYDADEASYAYNDPSSNGSHHSSNTIVDAREGVVDAQLVRELQPAHAIAILSLAGQSMDDILTLLPIYID